jgi:Protein of unknown function (DUF2721)
MLIDQSALSGISQAIVDAMAPAFILAAVAALISAMTTRLFRIQDTIRALSSGDANSNKLEQPSELNYLKIHARAISTCVLCLVACAMFVVLYIMIVFVTTILSLHFERLILNIFLIAFVFLFFALLLYAREVWLLRNKEI